MPKVNDQAKTVDVALTENELALINALLNAQNKLPFCQQLNFADFGTTRVGLKVMAAQEVFNQTEVAKDELFNSFDAALNRAEKILTIEELGEIVERVRCIWHL